MLFLSFSESVPFRSTSTLPVPHPSSHPPTPTRLIGTGPSFEFGEERGDLIQFYNQVWNFVVNIYFWHKGMEIPGMKEKKKNYYPETVINEPRHEKTCLGGFCPGLTQTGLYGHRRWLEA